MVYQLMKGKEGRKKIKLCKCMYCGCRFKLDYRNRKGCCLECERLNLLILQREVDRGKDDK